MQKSDLIRAVADRVGCSQKDAKEVIEAALAIIAESMVRGEKVTLTGFGTFEVRDRHAREGVNPQTREKISIPAAKTPGFVAGSVLKSVVRNAT